MSTRRALKIIREIRSEWHKPMRPGYGKICQHELNAYELWAYDEIYIWVLNSNTDPIAAVQELMDLADEIQANAKLDQINTMFNTLYDMSAEVYDVLRLIDLED